MDYIKKYLENYSTDVIGYTGSALIGASLGLAICKLL